MSGDAAADRAVLSRHGRSFRFAGRLLGRELFDRAAGLYAACRAIDDLADEHPDPAAARRTLCALRDDLRADLPPRTALGAKLHALRVDRQAAAVLVETVISDLEPVRVPDEAALLRYGYGAAGTVGLMMCDVLGVADPVARPHAVALGIAMQLTNIARDVREDARRDRIYLPRCWLWPEVTPRQLLDADPERVFAAVGRLLALAERHYAEGIRGLGFLDRRAALAIGVAAARYRAIGDAVLRRGPAYLSAPRPDVSGIGHCLLALRCTMAWLTPGGVPDRERITNTS